LASLDNVYSAAQHQQKAAQRGQMDLFGGQEVAPLASATVLVAGDPVPKKTLLAWEKEYLGVYLTENPLSDLYDAARASGKVFQTIVGIESDLVGEHVNLLAMIRSIRRIVTRTNRTMAILEIEDLTGVIEAVLFPESYERCSAQFEIEEAPEVVERSNVVVTIRRNGSFHDDIRAMNQLASLCREFRGDDRLYIRLRLGAEQRLLRAGFQVDWCGDLQKAMADIVGRASVEELSGRMEDTRQMVAD
jgi:DNA polymerase-3 subunit alpha